ncbi:DUF2584 family protein [Aquisalibacillus elongatus]|uniref:Uncharacterized protein DUF2584 n=1 Tax=Aquisalibacillus elongatus TaxID=485577 RepID=A0A3N5BED2_9BACI|nr:DUF2584 family protein [Aquisalibacillus elongatus]RPF55823.1 uncharacterized protein DUF2584 [Aquisalibacillus elongatus]
MPTPLSMEWKIITYGEELRLDEASDVFEVTLDGYKLFPIDETVEVLRHPQTNHIGIAKVVKLTFENQQTKCRYQLISLKSVN